MFPSILLILFLLRRHRGFRCLSVNGSRTEATLRGIGSDKFVATGTSKNFHRGLGSSLKRGKETRLLLSRSCEAIARTQKLGLCLLRKQLKAVRIYGVSQRRFADSMMRLQALLATARSNRALPCLWLRTVNSELP